MAYETASLREYYLLKNRESFFLDPFEDRAVYFGDAVLAKRIASRIEGDFLEARAIPKFFVHGHFGSGKTHTLFHIAYQLETRFRTMYPTEPIYLDIAPLSSKERWLRIHTRLVDALGLDRLRDAAETVADSLQEKDKVEGFITSRVLPFGDQTLKRSQANVFRNLLFGGKQMHLSWEWMKGRRTSVEEAQTLGTQKQLEEPQDLVYCLLNLGALFKEATKSRIVYLVDEGEAFRNVTNPDSVTELIHAIRLLLENSNSYIGFVFAAQIEGDTGSGGFLFEQDDIRRRVGYDQGYIDLNSLLLGAEPPQQFIRKTLEYLLDQEKAKIVIAKEKLDTTPELFPFTEGAVETIARHVQEDPLRALPAGILSYMSSSAIGAWRRREESPVHQLVDETAVEEAIYPDEVA